MNKICLNIKTLFGKRETIKLEVLITDKGQKLLDILALKIDLTQYYSYKLVWPMG